MAVHGAAAAHRRDGPPGGAAGDDIDVAGRDRIALSLPDIGPAEEAAVLEVLRSRRLAMGERTQALEAAWASYCGVGHAVFMANGTLALEALLTALGIGPGDEVITVSFSFNATASAILRVGAMPVFVDVRADDFCMDPALVEAAITSRTKAILPVHMYGLMSDMDALVEIARRRGVPIVEDAAQAIGAHYHGRSAGQFGPAMFSLYATKNVSAGEGGMVTTNDEALADRVRVLRNHGMQTRYDHVALGTNAKPTEIAAALALVQLKRLDELTARRQANAVTLSQALVGCVVPRVPDGRAHAWHQYTVRFADQRDVIVDELRSRGIDVEVYYPTPIHRQPYIKRHAPHLATVRLPVTERLSREVLSLPVRANLTEGELGRVITSVNSLATGALSLTRPSNRP